MDRKSKREENGSSMTAVHKKKRYTEAFSERFLVDSSTDANYFKIFINLGEN
jgi:hypothetical protein